VYIKTKYGEVKNYIDDKLSPERDGKEDKFGNR
jgi:hypothetical protein